MMAKNIFRETVPLGSRDCFVVFRGQKNNFDLSMHTHATTELNLVLNAAGAKRIIGDQEYITNQLDLVLIGPNVKHGWHRHQFKGGDVDEVTVHVHPDLLSNQLLERAPLIHIKKLLDDATGGIVFSACMVAEIMPRLMALSKKGDFKAILELLSILHQLSNDQARKTFSNEACLKGKTEDTLLNQVYDIINRDYRKDISIADIARKTNTPPTFLIRYIKKQTGLTFTENLTEVRMQHVTDMLMDTTHSIAEIAFACGFSNICSFNKIFKRIKKDTPSQFRQKYARSNYLFKHQ